MLADMAAIVTQVNPELPITHAAPLADITAIDLLPQRVAGAFGFVGLLLAAIGIYGITAFNVTRRTREIGPSRGARRRARRVLRMVIGQAMRVSVPGAAIGLLLAAEATRLLVRMLCGVQPLDPVSFGTGGAVFCGLALAASWLPARRAASANPVDALRTE